MSALAEFDDLELAEFVSAGLCGPRNVTVGLGLYERLVNIILAHVFDDLIARPALRMDTRVDDQTNRAKEFGVKAAVVADRTLVEADFFA